MSASSRFDVAIHMMTVMAIKGPVPIGSEDVADRANTNAVVIRKIVGMLNKAGLTRSQPGAGGGSLLALPASKITLLDIYQAVETQEVFGVPRCPPDQSCPVGSKLGPVLDDIKQRSTRAMEKELAKVTLAQLAKALRPKP